MNDWWLMPAPTNETSAGGTPAISASWRVVFCTEWQSPTICVVGVPS